MTNEIYAEWKKMRNKVESASAGVYLQKNERTEKEYEEALEALAQFEKDNGIPVMADEAQVKAMLPKRNFDRVTASPEKLAEFITNYDEYCGFIGCNQCPIEKECGNGDTCYTERELLVKWLKQESTE